MSSKLKFYKVDSIPAIIEPDSMYIYKDISDRIVLAITDTTGNIIYTTHNTTSIVSLINSYIDGIIDQPNGIPGLSNTGKVNILTISEVLGITDLTTYDTESGSGNTALKSTIINPLDGQHLVWRNGDWVNESDSDIIIGSWNGNVPQQSGTTRMYATTGVPPITEGTQIMTQTITPKSVNSKFIIKFSPMCTTGTNSRGVMLTLFRNNTFLTMGQIFDSSGYFSHPTLHFVDEPNIDTPITYTIRVGITGGNGTWYIGRSSANTYGGTVPSSWNILEVKN